MPLLEHCANLLAAVEGPYGIAVDAVRRFAICASPIDLV
jgi:hypothetical protein